MGLIGEELMDHCLQLGSRDNMSVISKTTGVLFFPFLVSYKRQVNETVNKVI